MDKTALKQLGFRVTTPRLKVLEILETASDRHMSAEAVYKALVAQGEDVGLATVYRVLTQFEAADLVKRLHFEGDHAVYELNQGAHHDHLFCVECGAVEEFVDPIIESRQAAIAKEAGFKMLDHSMNIYGLCGKCV